MQSVRNVCKGNKFTVASSISRSYNLYEAASTSGWEVAGGKFSDKSAASGRKVYTCIPDGRGGFSCFFQVSVVYTARKFQRRIEAFSGVTEQRQDLAVKILENYRSVEAAISWRHTFSVQPASCQNEHDQTRDTYLARILPKNRACVINANLDTKQV